MYFHLHIHSKKGRKILKGTRILFQFLFLIEKFLLNAKITVPQMLVLIIKQVFSFHSYNNVTNIH